MGRPIGAAVYKKEARGIISAKADGAYQGGKRRIDYEEALG